QFVAYYDRHRMMTVASRDIGSDRWQKTTLPSKLMWDSHNSVALGIDEQGYIHVSGNMHTHPLCYFRSEKPYDIRRMIAHHRMIGRDEERVTYPRFFYDRLGRLLFSYRSGTCGNGNILVNRFEPENERWVRHLNTPLFEGIEANDNRAAYHTYTKDAEGHFHFVWMWRWTPMVETCHQLCYATSPDLIHWKNAAGQPVPLPFRPDMKEVTVDDVPSKGGLHNSRYQIILTQDGRPMIGYVKYDGQGLTQLYMAKYDGGQWISKQISDWDFRWKFIEGGDQMTEGGRFRLAGISEEGVLVIPWSTEKGDSGQYTLDTETLEPATTVATVEPSYPEAVRKRLSDTPGLSVNLSDDNGGTQEDGVRYLLKWESRGGSHGRHAPQVIPEGPVSRLVVLKIQ
ncbi:MAG TPA: BNR repeat-containing protein, partial [Sedimentisphaerales bacterium]|nr:BNR repeat-containing protein [Sedimentisphaerales bacterium]